MKAITDSMSAQQRESFFDALTRHATTVLTDIKVDQDRVDIAVADIVALVSEDFAGQHIYIPTDYTHRSMERSLAVYNAIKGRNFAQVATQFGCAERTVYRIYKRMRKLMVAKNQSDLFN